MTKKTTTDGLRKLNLLAAFLHAAQGVAILILAKPFYVPVAANFTAANDTSNAVHTASSHLFDVNLAWVLAAFLLVTAFMRLASATRKRGMYEDDLKRNINRARWAEYATAGSIMLLTVAAIVGIVDVALLVALVGMNIAWSVAALATELRVGDRRLGRMMFWLSLLLHKMVWVPLLIYGIASYIFAEHLAPGFVYTALASTFVLASLLQFNLFRFTRRSARNLDYLKVERNYVLLTMAVQTVLTWQVFAGFLR